MNLGTSYAVSVREDVLEDFLLKFSGDFSLEKFPKKLIASWFGENIDICNSLSVNNGYFLDKAFDKMKNYKERVQREAQIPQIAELRAKDWCVGISKDFKYLKLRGKHKLEELLKEGFCYFESCCYGGSEDGPVPTGNFYHIQEQPVTVGYPGIYREKNNGGYYVDYIEHFVKFLEEDKAYLNTPRSETETGIIGEIEVPKYDELSPIYDLCRVSSHDLIFSEGLRKENALILKGVAGRIFTDDYYPWFLTNLPKKRLALLDGRETYDHSTKTGYYFCKVGDGNHNEKRGQNHVSIEYIDETTEWLKNTQVFLGKKEVFTYADCCLIDEYRSVYERWISGPEGWVIKDEILYWSKEAPVKSIWKGDFLASTEAIKMILGKEPQIKKWVFDVKNGILKVFVWDSALKKHFIGENGARIKQITEALKPIGVKEIRI